MRQAGKRVSIQEHRFGAKVSEHGLGAVIPDTLNSGEEVTLEFKVNSCDVVVRYSRGIHYGFEFLGLSERDDETLKEIRPRAVGHQA